MKTLVGKRCSTCRKIRSFHQFHKNRNKADGLQSMCKECKLAYCSKWAHANSDKCAEASARWRARNPERFKASMKSWQQRTRQIAIEIYGGECNRCGSTERLEFDHLNNDGAEHREIEGHKSMYARIAREGKPITDYALNLLCLPCHRYKSGQERRRDNLRKKTNHRLAA
jgi:hypothetical protein